MQSAFCFIDLTHYIMKTKQLFFILLSISLTGVLRAQKDYAFASTGQQKLLINPSLAAGQGLDVQTVTGFIPANSFRPFISNYSGVSYGCKKFGFGLSNTYYNSNYYYPYTSNQTDLSLSYKV